MEPADTAGNDGGASCIRFPSASRSTRTYYGKLSVARDDTGTEPSKKMKNTSQRSSNLPWWLDYRIQPNRQREEYPLTLVEGIQHTHTNEKIGQAYAKGVRVKIETSKVRFLS